jgi:glycosyltransferase involved in cell wall biosynthesis
MKKTANEIAVIIPCFNEESTINSVIVGFRKALPTASIYVCDNNSTDQTKTVAKKASAIVLDEPQRGKANAVRRLFREVEADIYIMIDGDNTYDPVSAEGAVRMCLDDQLDMLIGVRVSKTSQNTYPGLRSFGNKIFTFTLKFLFKSSFSDTLSGYRILSKRFVKSMPVMSKGFGIETEMNVYALALHLPVAEFRTPYYERPTGSQSKLNTFKDGFVIAKTIAQLLFDHRPLAIMGFLSIFLFVFGFWLFIPVFNSFVATGLVSRLPTAILSFGLIGLSIMALTLGILMDAISRGRLEAKQMRLLQVQK